MYMGRTKYSQGPDIKLFRQSKYWIGDYLYAGAKGGIYRNNFKLAIL